MTTPTRNAVIRSWMFPLLVLAIFWGWQVYTQRKPPPRKIPYSELLADLDAGRIQDVDVRADSILARLKSDQKAGARSGPERVLAVRLPGIDATSLVTEMRRKDVAFKGESDEPPWWEQLLLSWIFPVGLLLLLSGSAMRRMKQRGGPLSFARSKAKIFDRARDSQVSFADVAGVDEAQAELAEVVDFLKTPEKYRALGARIPKGVLLIGPPGTGKTLLARAVAGEASVPFFSISGSEFVEMFVGLGAARVRDLFEQAKQRAPCIVFIDEIDAIGRSRGGLAVMATNDEREQTLNQLLVEMDGFDATQGVILMAASNRPEVLDPALLRAGRFDRQVLVDRPDVRGREAILKIHTRNMKLASDVDLKVVAQRTPGMVGADLANAANEAALAAVRRGSAVLAQRDFEEAIDRLQLGLAKHGRVMNDEEKRRVAYHESGHTLVALSVAHADPVHRVTIIPRSIGALGATLQLPTGDRYVLSQEELRDRICVMLGGRAAEHVAFGDRSTGAPNDLERATETARQMVCRFGMSEELGAETFGRPAGARFLEMPVQFGEQRNFSEETARSIDREVSNILKEERARARAILEKRRPLLEQIAQRLLEHETLERADLDQLISADVAVRQARG